jgi:hypothetical protein
MSEPGDGQRPRVAAAVPTNHKQVLDFVAQARSEAGNRVYTAEIVREAIETWLGVEYDSLPPEARDLLDDDLKANGGEGELTIETVEEVDD